MYKSSIYHLSILTIFPENPGPLPVLKLCDPKPQFGTMPGDGALTIGDKRKDLVKHLQLMLRDLGFKLGTTGENNDGVDGVFGNLTLEAVKDFQSNDKDIDDIPLKSDGKVGPRTSDSLNRVLVGLWYDAYQVPKELGKGRVIMFATANALKTNLFLDTTDVSSAVVIIRGQLKHRIRLFLHDRIGKPLRLTNVEIQFDDKLLISSMTNDDGEVIVETDRHHEVGTAKYELSTGTESEKEVFSTNFFIDVKDIRTDEGLRRRLHNLGYLRGSDMVGAVTSFQATYGIETSGEPDIATRNKLVAVHDGDEAVMPKFKISERPLTSDELLEEGPP
jgi:peptidoglycan hydrolase-like protein with peptidoglycan-binding domain